MLFLIIGNVIIFLCGSDDEHRRKIFKHTYIQTNILLSWVKSIFVQPLRITVNAHDLIVLLAPYLSLFYLEGMHVQFVISSGFCSFGG